MRTKKQTKSMTKAIKSNAAKAKQFFADKMAFTTGPVEVSHQIEKGEDVAIIDVREAKDFKKGHVPGALSLPQEKWSTLAGLRRVMNIIYCYAQNCHRAPTPRCSSPRRVIPSWKWTAASNPGRSTA